MRLAGKHKPIHGGSGADVLSATALKPSITACVCCNADCTAAIGRATNDYERKLCLNKFQITFPGTIC